VEAGGGKWSAFVLAAAAPRVITVSAAADSPLAPALHGGSGSVPRYPGEVHRDVGVRMRWPAGSAPKEYYLGCLDARAGSAVGRLFRRGVLVQARPRLLWGRQLPHRPRRAGISAIAATRSAGLRGRRLGWFAHPGRPVGMIMAGFVPIFGVQAFEKQVGTAGFEPAIP
jgi:hypothetical protein